jgi:hypothetical protein
MYKSLIIFILALKATALFSQENESYQGYALQVLNSENKNLENLTPELNYQFNLWKEYLNQNQLFNIPSTEICADYLKGNLEYDFSNKNMPLRISSVKYLKFNVQGIEYFYIKYDLDNCLGGSTFFRDFVFFKRNKSTIAFDIDFTNKVKKAFLKAVNEKLSIKSDPYCHAESGSNFIHTDGLKISDFHGDNINGKYAIQGDGANCCPEYSGDFEYSISNNQFTFKNEIFESQNVQNDENNEEFEEIPVLSSVEKQAEFVGGNTAMIKFITKNLIIPKSESTTNENNLTRTTVNVGFVVQNDGTLSNIVLENKSIETSNYETIIIECFQKMPKWIPAEQNGKKVKSYRRVPINIQI